MIRFSIELHALVLEFSCLVLNSFDCGYQAVLALPFTLMHISMLRLGPYVVHMFSPVIVVVDRVPLSHFALVENTVQHLLECNFHWV